MNRYDTIDLFLTEDGDFALDGTGDLRAADGNALIHQNISNALKSSNPDWFMEDFPADLEDLIGMENSEETAEVGKQKIKNSLVRTGFFDAGDIWVEARPAGEMQMVFFIFINSPFAQDPLLYQADLDLGFGASVRRVR